DTRCSPGDARMRTCLFEDRGALDLAPLSLTRPVFDLLCGPFSLAQQQLRICPAAQLGMIVRHELAELIQAEHAGDRVNDSAWLRRGPIVFVNGRWQPPLPTRPLPTESCVGVANGSIAFAVVTPDLLPRDPIHELDDFLERLRRTLPTVAAGGIVVQHLWDLIHANTARLCEEFDHRSAAEEDDTAGWK